MENFLKSKAAVIKTNMALDVVREIANSCAVGVEKLIKACELTNNEVMEMVGYGKGQLLMILCSRGLVQDVVSLVERGAGERIVRGDGVEFVTSAFLQAAKSVIEKIIT